MRNAGRVVVLLLFASCSGGPDGMSQKAETLRFDDGQVAHCAPRAPNVYDVEIVDEHGALTLSATLDGQHEGKLGIVWRMPSDDAERRGLLRVEQTVAGAPIDCQVAGKLAHGLAGARDKLLDLTPKGDSKPYDNWGCDLGPIAQTSSCGSKGGCCDAHDACFWNNGCSQSDWWHTIYCDALPWPFSSSCYTACDQCNLTVRSCIVSVFSNPGPSACCQWNVCGWQRNPNNHWGCVSDSMCPYPGTRCDWNSGLCKQVCQPKQWCDVWDCGYVSDGCGGWLYCGNCEPDPCEECSQWGEECCYGEYCAYEGCCY